MSKRLFCLNYAANTVVFDANTTAPTAGLARLSPSALILIALVCGCGSSEAPEAEETVASTVQRVTGNITPASIQNDGPASGSPGADADWVLDSLANSGVNCLQSDGVATCIEANITGAAGGVGHWNGVRIVDGIASADQDIFLTGGKEND